MGPNDVDRSGVECAVAQELVSARADDELTRRDEPVLDAHLDGCHSCREFADRIARLDRTVRLRPAESVPDLVPVIMSRVRPGVLGRGGWLRPAIAWVAVVMFAQNIAALLFGDVAGTETHLARHLGAFGVALAIGFAFVAWRPHRAYGMLPFAGALIATMVVSTVVDVVDGGRSAVAEATHITEFVGLALLWMIAGSPGWHGWRELWDRITFRHSSPST